MIIICSYAALSVATALVHWCHSISFLHWCDVL